MRWLNELLPEKYIPMNKKNLPTPKEHLQAIGLLLLTAIFWSFGGVLIKWVQWHPIAIAGMRSAIALVVLLIASPKMKLNYSKIQIGGAIAYALTVILFVSATKLTTAANAILLQYTAPIYVALWSHSMLNERIHKMDWIMIFAALGGMALFFLDQLSFSFMFGNCIAILSGVAFAGFVVLMRKQKAQSPLGSIVLGNFLTACIGLPFMFHSTPSWESWIGLLLLGIFQIGIPALFYAKAIRVVTALEGILIPMIEPVLNPIWVFLFLKEKPGFWAIVGGILVLLVIFIRSIFVKNQKFSHDF